MTKVQILSLRSSLWPINFWQPGQPFVGPYISTSALCDVHSPRHPRRQFRWWVRWRIVCIPRNHVFLTTPHCIPLEIPHGAPIILLTKSASHALLQSVCELFALVLPPLASRRCLLPFAGRCPRSGASLFWRLLPLGIIHTTFSPNGILMVAGTPVCAVLPS